MAATAIDSLRGILNGFRDLNSKGIYTMNATETDLLRQILLEVQALSLGGLADGSVTTSKIADLNVTEAKLADLNVTTSKIADLNVTEAKLALAFKQSLFNQNLFKNPAFSVIQGTASGTLANSTALPTQTLGYQGETEWCVAASGGTPAYAFSAVDERVTFTGAASTTAIYLAQRIESRDANKIKGKSVTFSCEISNSLLTSVTWEVFRATTTNDVHGTIATPTQTLIASGTFTVTSTLTRYSATFDLPDLASRGLEVRLRVGAQTSGTWVVARLQLEEGSLATNFNCDDCGEELRKCQRYFERTDFINSQDIGIGSTITTFSPPLAAGVRFDFKQIKLLAPIITTSSAATFTVAGSLASTISTVADTSGTTLRLQASSGSTSSSWTCVPVSVLSGAFLSASAHIP